MTDFVRTVARGSQWRQGDAGPVWFVEDVSDHGPVRLVRETPGPMGPVENAQMVGRETLLHGDGGWTEVSPPASLADRRAARGLSIDDPWFRSRVPHFYLSAGRKAVASVLADFPDLAQNEDAVAFVIREAEERIQSHRGKPAGPLAASSGEVELHRLAVSFGPLEGVQPGGLRETIDALREVHEVISRDGAAALTAIHHVVTGAVRLAQAAEGHLSELSGPMFNAWRCDRCGSVVPEFLVAGVNLNDEAARDALSQLCVVTLVCSWAEDGFDRVVQEDVRLRYLECNRKTDGEVHGPMRHVVARVTADSPKTTTTGGSDG